MEDSVRGLRCRAEGHQTLVADILEATDLLTAWIMPHHTPPSSARIGEVIQACCLNVLHLLSGEEFMGSVASHPMNQQPAGCRKTRSGRGWPEFASRGTDSESCSVGRTGSGLKRLLTGFSGASPALVRTPTSPSSVQHSHVLGLQSPASFLPAASEKRLARARIAPFRGPSWSCGQHHVQPPANSVPVFLS